MSAQFDQWSSLSADLVTAGFSHRLESSPFQDVVHGRPRHGVRNSITLKFGRELIEITDSYFHNSWSGWSTNFCSNDGITIAFYGPTRKRSEVVASVKRIVERIGAAA
jgi:hypothetical protein